MEVSNQLHAPSALPRKTSLVPNEQDAGRAPDSVWTLWRREKSLVPADNRGSITGQGHCAKLCYHGSYGSNQNLYRYTGFPKNERQ
jgi:hypothetical protein